MGELSVDVGQWNWQNIFDKINNSIKDAGVNTVLHLSRPNIHKSEFRDVPEGATPTAILNSKQVYRLFNERNCMPFFQNIENDGVNETIERHYGFLVVPEKYKFAYTLFTDGLEEYEVLSKKIIDNFNGGAVVFQVDNPYDEKAPFELTIKLSLGKAERIPSQNQFSDIQRAQIMFTGKCIRMLEMPSDNPSSDHEIGDCLGIALGLSCINNIFWNIDIEISTLNMIQSFKKKSFLMTKEVVTLGTQYLNHEELDKEVFYEVLPTLPYFYPDLYEALSSGKKVQIQDIDEIKAKLSQRYKLVYKKSKEIYGLTGLPMEQYDHLNSISIGINRDGRSVEEAIGYSDHQYQAADAMISSFGEGIKSSVKGTIGDVAKTAAGVAIGNKISGNTGNSGAGKNSHPNYKGTAGCAISQGKICALLTCRLYEECQEGRWRNS